MGETQQRRNANQAAAPPRLRPRHRHTADEKLRRVLAARTAAALRFLLRFNSLFVLLALPLLGVAWLAAPAAPAAPRRL